VGYQRFEPHALKIIRADSFITKYKWIRIYESECLPANCNSESRQELIIKLQIIFSPGS
jgi:hypothetical protein